MKESTHQHISDQIGRLRWQAPLLALLLVLAHQLVEHTWLIHLPRWQHFATQTLFYGLIGPLLAWWALTSLLGSVRETEATQKELSEVNERLEFLLKVNRRLAEAEDEEALINVILDLPPVVVPALGCSLICFDERGQAMPAHHRGEVVPTIFEAWAAHLFAVEVLERCSQCATLQASSPATCPLLQATPANIAVRQVVCLPLRRNGREYGRLTIYLEQANALSEWKQAMLAAMANEMSLALESQHLRSRELAALYRLQQARRLRNLKDELTLAITHTVEALDADGGAIFMTDAKTGQMAPFVEAGKSLMTGVQVIQGLVSGVQFAESPLVISDLKQMDEWENRVRSLLVAPLHDGSQSLGSLVLWSDLARVFTNRRIRLVATIAGQMALSMENHRLYSQAEYQATLTERARLGREIHDGLAQTLGYLKLRTTQITGWLQQGDTERALVALEEVNAMHAAAYIDAREAIDGLSLKPGQESLANWLDQALTDFKNLSHIRVEAAPPPAIDLPPEVQTQLLRIVQEALSNIRKHAGANCVHLTWKLDDSWLTLCIADDGYGFDMADVPPVSQHGLRIMRERAELLNADFQVISKIGAGTQIVARLPVKADYWEGINDAAY